MSCLSSSSILMAPPAFPSPLGDPQISGRSILLPGSEGRTPQSPHLLGRPDAAHLDCVSLPSGHEQLLPSEFRNQC